MGILRFLLAIVVLSAHSGYTFYMISSQAAVKSFFIISGFYIAFILSNKYNNYKDFLINRMLKIYPVYFVVLFFGIILSIIKYYIDGNSTVGYIYELFLGGKYFIGIINTVLNIILVGVDFSGFIYYTYNLDLSSNSLVVSQAWTLGVEMLFYILSFLFIKLKTYKIIIIGLFLILLRYLVLINLESSGVVLDTFFPLVLIYFLLGILSYRIYGLLIQYNVAKYNIIGLVSLFFMSALIIFQNIFSIPENLYYIFLTILIPFIFFYSKYIKSDRFIGELSYPIYLVHFLVVYVVNYIFYQKTIINLLIIFIVTISISIILLYTIIKPIDDYRQQRISKKNI